MNSAAHASAASAGRAIESSVAHGAGAHCSHVAQVYGEGFASQLAGRGRRAEKMDPFGQQVRGEDQRFAAADRQHGAVVADALESVVGKRGEKGFYAVDDLNSVMEELCYGAKLPIFSVNLIIFVRESPAWGVRLMNETMKILILNGPNLNLQGRRDTGVYGSQTFESYFEALKANYPSVEFGYFQSTSKATVRQAVQQADGVYDGVVLNAGGYTHTSVALRDAVSAVSVPVVEVHISSILAREEFRHTSLLAPVAAGSIMGFGLNSYRLGVYALLTGAEK